MKQAVKLVAVLCLLAGVAFTQQTPVPNPNVAGTFDGIYYAPNFAKWQLNVANTIAASGTSILVNAGFTTTADGITFVPFAVKQKINVGTGSTSEIATISAVSGCNALAMPGATPVCTLTVGALSNAHGIGEPITSADNGIIEATAYASQTGGGNVYFLVDCGNITLSTGGLTTTSTCFVPNVFYNGGASGRVTTTIATTASWAVGIANATQAFCTTDTTLTAGTTCIANQGAVALSSTSGPTVNDLTAVLITGATSNATAGKVHVKVWGFSPAQSAY